MKRDPDLWLLLHLYTSEKPHGGVWPLRARCRLCSCAVALGYGFREEH